MKNLDPLVVRHRIRKFASPATEFAGYVWTQAIFEKRKLRIQKFPDTCGRGLSLNHLFLNTFRVLQSFAICFSTSIEVKVLSYNFISIRFTPCNLKWAEIKIAHCNVCFLSKIGGLILNVRCSAGSNPCAQGLGPRLCSSSQWRHSLL